MPADIGQTHNMAGDTRGVRLGLLGVVALILIGILGTRLWFLQVVDAESITAQVQATRTKAVDLPPQRGRIFDVEGRILADNQRVLTVIIDQDVLRGRDKSRQVLFERLAGPLKTSAEALQIRYCGVSSKDPNVHDPKCNGGIYNSYLPFPAADDVDEATALYLRERIEDYPGVDVQEGWRRKYLYAPTASQIVGYLGRIPENNPKTPVNETKEYLKKGYSLNDLVGAAGIEQQFETELRGTPGHAEFEVDAAGRVLATLNRTEPTPGNDVQLTIDLKLQKFAEQTLETELHRSRNVSPYPDTNVLSKLVFYKAPAGSVVVEKSGTGEIAAMASYPTFDNRWFSSGVSGAKFKQLFPPDTDKNPDTFPSPLVNRAIQGRYNVGSTFKPFTAYAALNTGFIGPTDEWVDVGSYTIPPEHCDPNKVAKCTFKNSFNFKLNAPSVYGSINVSNALTVSSDAYFYRIGSELFSAYPDTPVLQNEYKKFGFGEKSGIDLPYEYKGIVPDKDIKKKLADQGAITQKEGQGFYVGDAILMSIGQGLNAVTPLQLTTAYATIANGGYLLKPLIVKAVYPSGVPDDSFKPGYADLSASTPEQVFSTVVRHHLDDVQSLEPIVKGLTCVVRILIPSCPQFINGRTPTAQGAFLKFDFNHIPFAGKTGTAQGAQNKPENDSSVFVGFQIGENGEPKLDGYTIGAYLEKAGYGKRAAAPVVRCMMLAVNGAYEAVDDIQLSDALDIRATTAAPRQIMKSDQCLVDATPTEVTDRRER